MNFSASSEGQGGHAVLTYHVGTGSVIRSPDKTVYEQGEIVTLSASPGRYYQFSGWSDGSRDPNRVIVVGAHNKFIAYFTNAVPLEHFFFTEWESTLGLRGESLIDIKQSPDGGYVIGASTSDAGAPPPTVRIIRLDSSGQVSWEKGYGKGGPDGLISIAATLDGGYIVGAVTVPTNSGQRDFWAIKLDRNGDKQWDKTFGGGGSDQLSKAQQTSDGGYILCGSSASQADGNKTSPNFGAEDYWVVRLDGSGNKLWEKSYGSSQGEGATSISQTADGGFLIGGYSLSPAGGNKSSPSWGNYDFWIVCADSNGEKLWDKTFGGSQADGLTDIQQTWDEGYVLAGSSGSGVDGNKTSLNFGADDFWVVRLDASGNKLWEKSFGGYERDFATAIRQTVDGGYIVSGGSYSGPSRLNSDGWVIRLDSNGEKLCDQFFGGYVHSLQQTSDGGYILGGEPPLSPGGMWVAKIGEIETRFGSPRILVNGSFRTNGFVLGRAAEIHMKTTFTNGSIFYTLDGSEPGLSSYRYSGPITITHSATVRAIAYGPDFSESAKADPVPVTVLPSYPLMALTDGGGEVRTNPQPGPYISNSVATVTAVPNPGWEFLQWTGGIVSTSSTLAILMDSAKTIRAEFGTSLSATVLGRGTVSLNPEMRSYPYGSTVILSATPAPGYYFATWGNAATVSSNPLPFRVVSSNPVASAVFLPKVDQTLLFEGRIEGMTNPRIVLDGTSSSGLPISYSLISGSGNLVGNIITFPQSGDFEIVVRGRQDGNAIYDPAPPVDRTFNLHVGIPNLMGAGDKIYQQSHVPEFATNVAAIACGAFHSIALRFDGSVVAWGKNWNGQSDVPAGLSNIIEVAAGGGHSLALNNQGTVIAWGRNVESQTNVPPTATNIVAISGGNMHSVALRGDGTVVAWGNNEYRQTSVSLLATEVTSISAGAFHNLALRVDGTVVAWGDNSFGQLDVPLTASNITAVAAGNGYSLALRSDGKVIGWGDNRYGQCSVPTSATNIVAIAAGVFHSVGLKADGTLLFWGRDYLGVRSGIESIGNVSAIAVGEHHTLVITGSKKPHFYNSRSSLIAHIGGGVLMRANVQSVPPMRYQWFRDNVAVQGATNSSLFLNNVRPSDSAAFTLSAETSTGAAKSASIALTVDDSAMLISKVGAWGDELSGQIDIPLSAANTRAVSAGAFHGLALQFDGTVIGWGKNFEKQATVPAGLSNVISVAAGAGHSLALNADGTVSGWGRNTDGQIDIPVSLSNVVAIAAGWGHSVALKEDGTVVSWGNNEYGQVNTFPVSGAIAIAAGYYHTLALLADGNVVAWGADSAGQCIVPVSATNVVAIAAGEQQSIALRADGKIIAWGADLEGALTPPETLTDAIAISSGLYHNIAIRVDGTVYSWGKGYYGTTNTPTGLRNVAQVAAGEDFTIGLVHSGPPQLTPQRRSAIGFQGSQVVLRCDPTGSFPFNFQWQHNGAQIPGATNRNLLLTNLVSELDGEYVVTVSNQSGTTNSLPIKVTVSQGKPPLYSLTVESHGHGSVFLDPSRMRYFPGETVTVTAVPASDHEFLYLTGNIVSTEPESSIVMTQDSYVTAVFQPTNAPHIMINGQRGWDFEFDDLSPVRVAMASTFPRGTIFYTVDGSAPTFASTVYGQEFALTQTTTIRAIAVSTNFVTAEAEPVRVQFVSSIFPLAVSTPGGGRVEVLPQKPAYRSNEVVTITAAPDPGWVFLGWFLDGNGTNQVLSLTMDRKKEIRALFGTPVTTSVTGEGEIRLLPTRTLYPFGTKLSFTPIPTFGNFFALWGGDGNGTRYPLEITVTNSNQFISALFSPLNTGQAALTVIVNGNGSINASPTGNVYPIGQIVALEAVPKENYRFYGWSGDLNTTNPVVNVVMDRSRTVVANFSYNGTLLISPELLPSQQFQFIVQGPTNEIYIIQRSENLNNWVTVTNLPGGMPFHDTSPTNALNFYRSVTP